MLCVNTYLTGGGWYSFLLDRVRSTVVQGLTSGFLPRDPVTFYFASSSSWLLPLIVRSFP